MTTTVQVEATSDQGVPATADVLIIGAGFAGISALYHLQKAGLDTHILESAPSPGGTWYHNRYPGARCDIESMDYSLSLTEELQQEWRWPERYSAQPVILDYFHHLVQKFDLSQRIHLNTTVEGAAYDQQAARWTITTDKGTEVVARFVVLATGVLSAAQSPNIPGMEDFRGPILHTADWPHEDFDFAGKRVGVIGTGSSGTQLIPIVAQSARELTVFQRTANYVMPARNGPITDEMDQEWKKNYLERRTAARSSSNGHNQPPASFNGRDLSPEERDVLLEERWEAGGVSMMRAFKDILTDPEVNAYASAFVEEKIRGIVNDPATADKLVPKNLPIGTKRLCSGTNYYDTFNLPHVHVVDVKADPIDHLSRTSLHTQTAEHQLDVLILATGFDAMTGSFLKMDIRGEGGLSLREHWSAGPRTHHGVSVAGFPNLFILSGPQSPSVFSNMATTSEMHAEWVTRCIRHVIDSGHSSIAADADAEDAWVEHVTRLASGSLYEDSRNSWFWGANMPGKPRVFMPYLGGVANYWNKLESIADSEYEGFSIT